LLLAFASVAAASRSSAAPEPFVINAIAALTGQGAYQGKMTTSGYKLYADLINRNGGIKGRPIQIDVLDDESNIRR
jgi:branched-chain amino acid transport system substrate-binding protein